MIKGLYETHLFVENLERSIDFYKIYYNWNNAILKQKDEQHFFG